MLIRSGTSTVMQTLAPKISKSHFRSSSTHPSHEEREKKVAQSLLTRSTKHGNSMTQMNKVRVTYCLTEKTTSCSCHRIWEPSKHVNECSVKLPNKNSSGSKYTFIPECSREWTISLTLHCDGRTKQQCVHCLTQSICPHSPTTSHGSVLTTSTSYPRHTLLIVKTIKWEHLGSKVWSNFWSQPPLKICRVRSNRLQPDSRKSKTNKWWAFGWRGLARICLRRVWDQVYQALRYSLFHTTVFSKLCLVVKLKIRTCQLETWVVSKCRCLLGCLCLKLE